MNDTIEGLLKQAIYDYAKKAIIQAIISKVPFLGASFFNPILGFFVGKILNIVYEHVYRAVSFAIVDIQIGMQKKAYEDAVVKLQETLAAEHATDKEIEDAKQKFKDSFRDLIKFPTK